MNNKKATSRPAFANVTEAVVNGRLYPTTENTTKNLKQLNENTYKNIHKPMVRKINHVKQRILNKPMNEQSEYNIYTLFDDNCQSILNDFQKELKDMDGITISDVDDLLFKERNNNENYKLKLKAKVDHLVKEGHNKDKIQSFIIMSEKERIRKTLLKNDENDMSWQTYNEQYDKSNKRPMSSLITHEELKRAKLEANVEKSKHNNEVTSSVKKQPLQRINEHKEDNGSMEAKREPQVEIDNIKENDDLKDIVLPANYYPGMALHEATTKDGVRYRYEDLDLEDNDDVLMVNEYVTDIFGYMYKSELQCLPNPTTMILHPNIKQNRDILVNWMIKIHNQFNLLPETLYLAVNIMDRFLSVKLVDLDRLQLVGTVSLFIASKYEEVYSPSCKNFASVTDGACCEEDIVDGEIYVLQTLNFKLDYPNPMNFLRRISKADEYHMDCRTVAKYLLEITIVDFRFIGIPPSKCAAAAFFLAKKMMGRPYWDGNFIHYSGGYSKENISPLVKMMMEYLEHPVIHDEFYKKYSTRRFCKASVASRDWAKRVIQQGFNVMDLHEQS
ncbi:hypothetical protein ACO0R3_000820 [Hanseniaspora guilliermondii]